MARFYRIYYEGSLNLPYGSPVILSKTATHHLTNVLRCKAGSNLNLFNSTGEWKCYIKDVHKNQVEVIVGEQVRWPRPTLSIHLFFTPLKSAASSFLISKATEIGATGLTQVVTERTISKDLSPEKIQLKAKEAAQQCKRLSLPTIGKTIRLKELAQNWGTLQTNNHLIWLNETQQGVPLVEAIAAWKKTLNGTLNTVATEIFLPKHHSKHLPKQCTLGILVGPEGGFSANELDYLQSVSTLTSAYLPGNTLRAETAAIAALTLAMYCD